jgi:hypothetical protein
MTAFIPPTLHQEIDFLDEVEREMVLLTTAELEVVTSAPPVTTTLKTVIPAEAGTHGRQAVNEENVVIATSTGYRPRPAPG